MAVRFNEFMVMSPDDGSGTHVPGPATEPPTTTEPGPEWSDPDTERCVGVGLLGMTV